MPEATKPHMSVDQARSVLSRSPLNQGANVMADVYGGFKSAVKETLENYKSLGRPVGFAERLKVLAMTPLYGITRIAAEAIANRTGGRLEPGAITAAHEVKRHISDSDWNETPVTPSDIK